MLSAGHVLAMDTKNLLDVCDSIRQRFPNIDYESAYNSVIEPNASLPQPHQSPKKMPLQPQNQSQEFYENIRAEAAENLYCNQNPPSEIGIYDNNSVIQQEQLRIVEEPILSPNGTNGVEAQ